jgi:hypothetical protein
MEDHSDETGTFQLTNPEREKSLIDSMKSKYEQIRGNGAVPVDGALFREFITNSYYEICKKYHCKQLVFTIENRSAEGGARIAAHPQGS